MQDDPARPAAQIPLAGVIGMPIAHSRSPRLHGFWLQRYGIAGHYMPLPVRAEHLADVLREVLEETGMNAADIDWVVPHQANARILDATARKLDLPSEKVVVTVDRHANTSAASVPLALDTAVQDGRIKQGDLVMFEAMGGGFTWGASLARM